MKSFRTPSLVYIKGEEMTRYASKLCLQKWILPHLDTKNWIVHDLSCKNRKNTNDLVISNIINDGNKVRSIYKEPTVTPTLEHVKKYNLPELYESPNALLRKGWNGVSVSRDTIHIKDMELGYKNQVIFDRHAVGGEYEADYEIVGEGKLILLFFPKDDKSKIIQIRKNIKDKKNAIVLYTNPLDNIELLFHNFFSRCLTLKIKPYIVTKKTAFKWHEEFWKTALTVFEKFYKQKFIELKICDELSHLLSDAAAMKIIQWKHGNFGMCSHNYDGDVLTDEISQVHKSPAFMISTLTGFNDKNEMVKEFEASHGTVTDMWNDHLNKKETSLNPLGMIESLLNSIEYSIEINNIHQNTLKFTRIVRDELHQGLLEYGTKDINSNGLCTEKFIEVVGKNIKDKINQ